MLSARRIVRGEPDALECVQDAFLDVLQSAVDARHLEALFMRSVKNRAIDMLRTRRTSATTLGVIDNQGFDAAPESIADKTCNWLLRTLKGEQGQCARTLLACNGDFSTAALNLACTESHLRGVVRAIRARYGSYSMPVSVTFQGGASYLAPASARTIWPLVAMYGLGEPLPCQSMLECYYPC
jgi:hypothetical protein